MALQPSSTRPEPPQPYTGPDFTGFIFSPLTSSSDKGPFTLKILTQADTLFLHQANITGTWGNGGTNPITGFIRQDNGILNLTCMWIGKNYTHTLIAELTYTSGSFVEVRGLDNLPVEAFIPPTATLNGSVAVVDNNWNPVAGGPGEVSGPGKRAFPI
jgi:hypothetical protein